MRLRTRWTAGSRPRLRRRKMPRSRRLRWRDGRCAHDAVEESAIISSNYITIDKQRPMQLAKCFEPHAIEDTWYPLWQSRGYFKPSWKAGAPAYCIALPPPNVTGTLHMGHAYQHTLMDVLIRYHRMRGDNTLWQVGTDHAGIATQIVEPD